MSCDDAENIRIEPCDVTWQIESKWQITTVADVSSSLNNKWIKMYSSAGIGYYAWFNVAAAGVDPAPAGFTSLGAVAIAVNATASAVASALNTTIDASAFFESTVSSNKVIVENVVAGATTASGNGTASPGFTFSQCRVGRDIYLGLLDGDLTWTPEVTVNDIMVHQKGTTPVTSLIQGVKGTASFTLKESDFDIYKEIFEAAGGNDTPVGGTEVFGMGTGKLGQSVVVSAARLIFHPVANAANDKSRDLCAWLAYPKPGEHTISGENPRLQALEFTFYPDTTKPANVNVAVFGNWSQYLPV